MDMFTNCLGFIAIVEHDKLVGYNVCVGGGMGRSHGNEATYPRMADVIGFFTPEKIVDVAKAVLTIHRDFGDRTDRKHARLKYVIAERGADWARAEIEKRAGITFAPAKPSHFTTTADLLGWHKAVDKSWFLGLFVDTGRIKDAGGYKLKTALRHIADAFQTVEFRLTAETKTSSLPMSATRDKHPKSRCCCRRMALKKRRRQTDRAACGFNGVSRAADLRPGARRKRAHAAGVYRPH